MAPRIVESLFSKQRPNLDAEKKTFNLQLAFVGAEGSKTTHSVKKSALNSSSCSIDPTQNGFGLEKQINRTGFLKQSRPNFLKDGSILEVGEVRGDDSSRNEDYIKATDINLLDTDTASGPLKEDVLETEVSINDASKSELGASQINKLNMVKKVKSSQCLDDRNEVTDVPSFLSSEWSQLNLSGLDESLLEKMPCVSQPPPYGTDVEDSITDSLHSTKNLNCDTLRMVEEESLCPTQDKKMLRLKVCSANSDDEAMNANVGINKVVSGRQSPNKMTLQKELTSEISQTDLLMLNIDLPSSANELTATGCEEHVVVDNYMTMVDKNSLKKDYKPLSMQEEMAKCSTVIVKTSKQESAVNSLVCLRADNTKNTNELDVGSVNRSLPSALVKRPRKFVYSLQDFSTFQSQKDYSGVQSSEKHSYGHPTRPTYLECKSFTEKAPIATNSVQDLSTSSINDNSVPSDIDSKLLTQYFKENPTTKTMEEIVEGKDLTTVELKQTAAYPGTINDAPILDCSERIYKYSKECDTPLNSKPGSSMRRRVLATAYGESAKDFEHKQSPVVSHEYLDLLHSNDIMHDTHDCAAQQRRNPPESSVEYLDSVSDKYRNNSVLEGRADICETSPKIIHFSPVSTSAKQRHHNFQTESNKISDVPDVCHRNRATSDGEDENVIVQSTRLQVYGRDHREQRKIVSNNLADHRKNIKVLSLKNATESHFKRDLNVLPEYLEDGSCKAEKCGIIMCDAKDVSSNYVEGSKTQCTSQSCNADVLTMNTSKPFSNFLNSGFRTASNKDINLSVEDVNRGNLLFREIEDEYLLNISSAVDNKNAPLPVGYNTEQDEINHKQCFRNSKLDEMPMHITKSVQASHTTLKEHNSTLQERKQQTIVDPILTPSQKAEVAELSHILEESYSQFEFTQFKKKCGFQNTVESKAAELSVNDNLESCHNVSDVWKDIDFDDSFDARSQTVHKDQSFESVGGADGPKVSTEKKLDMSPHVPTGKNLHLKHLETLGCSSLPTGKVVNINKEVSERTADLLSDTNSADKQFLDPKSHVAEQSYIRESSTLVDCFTDKKQESSSAGDVVEMQVTDHQCSVAHSLISSNLVCQKHDIAYEKVNNFESTSEKLTVATVLSDTKLCQNKSKHSCPNVKDECATNRKNVDVAKPPGYREYSRIEYDSKLKSETKHEMSVPHDLGDGSRHCASCLELSTDLQLISKQQPNCEKLQSPKLNWVDSPIEKTGFCTASGKKVEISKAALSKAVCFFAGEFSESGLGDSLLTCNTYSVNNADGTRVENKLISNETVLKNKIIEQDKPLEISMNGEIISDTLELSIQNSVCKSTDSKNLTNKAEFHLVTDKATTVKVFPPDNCNVCKEHDISGDQEAVRFTKPGEITFTSIDAGFCSGEQNVNTASTDKVLMPIESLDKAEALFDSGGTSDSTVNKSDMLTLKTRKTFYWAKPVSGKSQNAFTKLDGMMVKLSSGEIPDPHFIGFGAGNNEASPLPNTLEIPYKKGVENEVCIGKNFDSSVIVKQLDSISLGQKISENDARSEKWSVRSVQKEEETRDLCQVIGNNSECANSKENDGKELCRSQSDNLLMHNLASVIKKKSDEGSLFHAGELDIYDRKGINEQQEEKGSLHLISRGDERVHIRPSGSKCSCIKQGISAVDKLTIAGTEVHSPYPVCPYSAAKREKGKQIKEAFSGTDIYLEEDPDCTVVQKYSVVEETGTQRKSETPLMASVAALNSTSGNNVNTSSKASLISETVFSKLDTCNNQESEDISFARDVPKAENSHMANKREDFSLYPVAAFSTASGKRVSISKEFLKKAKNMFFEIDVPSSNESEVISVVQDFTKMERPELMSKAENSFQYSAVAFSTASGKSVTVSEESLKKAEQMFSETDTCSNSEPRVIPVEQSISKTERTKLTKKGCPLRLEAAFSRANGRMMSISEAILKKAKKAFSEIDTFDTSDFDLVSSAQNFSKTYRTNLPNEVDLLQCPLGAFSTASGKCLSISEDSLKKAKRMFAEIDVGFDSNVDTVSVIQNFSKTERSKLSSEGDRASLHPVAAFRTASGKMVNISEDSLRKAKKMFSEVDTCGTSDSDHVNRAQSFSKTNGANLTDEVYLPRCPPSAFSTAGGKRLSISEDSLMKAKRMFAEIDAASANNVDTVSAVQGFSKTERAKQTTEAERFSLHPVSAFSTASGKMVSISEDSLKKAKNMFSELDAHSTSNSDPISIAQDFSKTHKKKTENEVNVSLFPADAFSTASGKCVRISEDSLNKAKRMFAETDFGCNSNVGTVYVEQDFSQTERAKLTSKTDRASLYPVSAFSTAGGKIVNISEDSLKKSKMMFSEMDTCATSDSDPVHTAQGFSKTHRLNLAKVDLSPSLPGAFSTASGKNISISEDSLKKVKRMFAEIDVTSNNNVETASVAHNFSKTERTKLTSAVESLSPHPVAAFSTASGKMVSISEDSLKKAKMLFSETDASSYKVTKNSMFAYYSTTVNAKLANKTESDSATLISTACERKANISENLLNKCEQSKTV
ncbi:breast cancer type 2 susceptibility protein homolog [Protopterus annectens]|uniref:breast cancer type 2 susceptibility protein homolog n=1 Tax=Protopterus annectens TaxID=7888 RepID=UPI001CFA1E50|nr:breast cancer type 2 susceptibility protein homolog [Protopterus annectens]